MTAPIFIKERRHPKGAWYMRYGNVETFSEISAKECLLRHLKKIKNY